MNILVASHYFEHHRGGIEIVAGQLARAFTRMGHQVTWVACDSDAAPTDPSVCARTIALPAWNWLERRTGIPYPIPQPRTVSSLNSAIRAADIVLVQDAFFLPCLLTQALAMRADIPVVVMQHVGFVPYRSRLLRGIMNATCSAVTRPALRKAAQVVFISELTRGHFQTVRFRREPILMYNGVDTTVFTPLLEPASRQAVRRSLGLDSARPTMLFVGRFVEKKGLSYLERMARCRPDWTWAFAGWGPMDPMRWQLPNVRVFFGRSGATLAPLYQCADALVLPSVGEGYPLVIQEALACGLPVVCGDDTARADAAARQYLVGVHVGTDPVSTAGAFLQALACIVEATEQPTTNAPARAMFCRERYSWMGMASTLIANFRTLNAISETRVRVVTGGTDRGDTQGIRLSTNPGPSHSREQSYGSW